MPRGSKGVIRAHAESDPHKHLEKKGAREDVPLVRGRNEDSRRLGRSLAKSEEKGEREEVERGEEGSRCAGARTEKKMKKGRTARGSLGEGDTERLTLN